jgi:EAL domain-containing protein (putative c-di-GMP-specific phosphodiesterase class I)
MADRYIDMHCQCPEGLRLVTEYQYCREEFEKLKKELDDLVMTKACDLPNLAKLNERLMMLSIDFEDEELVFRQDLWHARIEFLLLELDKWKGLPPPYRINCETIRHWLEEG